MGKSSKHLIRSFLAVYLLLTSFPSVGAAPPKTESPKDMSLGITFWSRKVGPHHDTPNPPKIAEKFVPFRDFKITKRKIYDAQYGRSESYRGIALQKILAKYKPQPHDDSFVLHFQNKMAILMPRNSSYLTKLSPFVALEICPPKKGPCDSQFPDISKDEIDSPYHDPRPLTFQNSKLVVKNLEHPDIINPTKPIFSPWKYVDSLVGVEYVNSEAYKKQFFFGEEPGEKVFWQRCQFCHGVRLIGSRMGWDFVHPLPIYEKRSPEILLNHIKYPKIRAKQMGLMMPTQPDMEISEAESLWKWLKLAAQKPTPEYRP